LNRLYNMDCMEGMAQFPDKYFDLAIVDPPYGIQTEHAFVGAGKLKNRTLNINGKDVGKWDVAPSSKYFAELFRTSKNSIIWGGNYFNLPPTRCFVVWDKAQPFENFSACEFAWTSFNYPSKVYKEQVTLSVPSRDRIHPTQKSVKLYQWLLAKFARPGDKIIDTHAGSAASLVACHGAKYDYVGFEINSDYYNAALERLEKAKAQLDLFNDNGGGDA